MKTLITVILICLVIVYVIVSIIKYKLDSKFKKNCFDCKYYELFDVASVGDCCRYKCTLKDECNRHSMNDRTNFVKCEEFEDKVIENVNKNG